MYGCEYVHISIAYDNSLPLQSLVLWKPRTKASSYIWCRECTRQNNAENPSTWWPIYYQTKVHGEDGGHLGKLDSSLLLSYQREDKSNPTQMVFYQQFVIRNLGLQFFLQMLIFFVTFSSKKMANCHNKILFQSTTFHPWLPNTWLFNI